MESVPRAVATGFSLISKIRIANNVYPVATALGTDLITKLGHYSPTRASKRVFRLDLSECRWRRDSEGSVPEL